MLEAEYLESLAAARPPLPAFRAGDILEVVVVSAAVELLLVESCCR